MFRRTAFAAVSFALSLAASAPALAQQAQDFYPDTSAADKFEWAKQAYPVICRAPVPKEFRSIRFESLNGLAQWYIGNLSMNDLVGLVGQNCGNKEAAASYVSN